MGAYEFLLKTNWIRPVAWSAYGLLGLWMVWQTASSRTNTEGVSSADTGRPMDRGRCGAVSGPKEYERWVVEEWFV